MDKLGIGRKMERLVMNRWEADGFDCWQPKRSASYGPGTDIFGLFDFVAVKSDCSVNFVQVKRRRAKEAETARERIKSWQDGHSAPTACFLVLWHKERRTERLVFRAERYYGGDEYCDWSAWDSWEIEKR